MFLIAVRPFVTKLLAAASPAEQLDLLASTTMERARAAGSAVVQVLRSGELRVAASAGVPDAIASFRDELGAIDASLGDRLAKLAGGRFAHTIVVPLRTGQDLLGAVVMFFSSDAPPKDEPLRLAEDIIDLAALALANAFQLEELGRTAAEVRASRAALERTQKLRALGEMAAGVSHDLKNILNPLSLHLQLLERTVSKSDASAHESIAELKAIVRRGVETVERLRAFSRQAPERAFAEASLDDLAREAVEICKPRVASRPAGKAGVRIVTQLGSPPRVLVQSAEVVAAIVNLIVNAIEAQPEGGVVEVSTRDEDGGSVVRVRDEGPGIAPEVQQRMFEPFFTTKGAAGTGLGLAMVYALALRHGGRVTLESHEGRGATFAMWFPRPA